MPSSASAQGFVLQGRAVRHILPIQEPGQPLPESLLIAPGSYNVRGECYDFNQEGLYRIIHPPDGDIQRIVYSHDRLRLMESLSWLVSHGYRDNGLTEEQIATKALREKLVLTCGDCCRFMGYLCHQLEVPFRVLSARTLESFNGFNDGHILMEVMLDGRWIVFDPDRGRRYRCGDRYLNLLELVRNIRTATYDEEILTAAIPVAIGAFSNANTHYDLWMETWLGHTNSRSELLERALGIPLIAEAGVLYYTVVNREDYHRIADLAEMQGWHYLPEAEFEHRFYPSHCDV